MLQIDIIRHSGINQHYIPGVEIIIRYISDIHKMLYAIPLCSILILIVPFENVSLRASHLIAEYRTNNFIDECIRAGIVGIKKLLKFIFEFLCHGYLIS